MLTPTCGGLAADVTVRFVLNRAGIRQLLRSAEMQAELKRRAERIATAAGPGHEVQVVQGRNRARATVRTTTTEAVIAQEQHQNLTHAIGAGRG